MSPEENRDLVALARAILRFRTPQGRTNARRHLAERLYAAGDHTFARLADPAGTHGLFGVEVLIEALEVRVPTVTVNDIVGTMEARSGRVATLTVIDDPVVPDLPT